MIHPISNVKALDVLSSSSYGHLGCIVDDEPYVVPINYVWDQGQIYIHSLPGKKIDGMRENRRVCLQVERIASEYRWSSVHVFGDFEELTDEREVEAAARLVYARFPRLTPADSVRRYGHLVEETVIFRIRIDRIEGITEE